MVKVEQGARIGTERREEFEECEEFELSGNQGERTLRR